MPSTRVSTLVVMLFLAVAFSCQRALSQDDPAFQLATQPYRSYHGGNIDKVDLFSGNLSIDIPLISYPQRGGKLSFGFALHYQSGPATGDNYCDGEGDCWFQSTDYAHGWEVVQEGVPSWVAISSYNDSASDSTCDGVDYICSYTLPVITPDGAVSQLTPISTANGPSCDAAPCELTTMSGLWRAVDGTGYEATPTGIIVDGNGTQYSRGIPIGNFDWTSSLSNYSIFSSASNPRSPAQIEDTNGNEIVATMDPATSFVGSWTDTLGRTIPNSVPDTPSD